MIEWHRKQDKFLDAVLINIKSKFKSGDEEIVSQALYEVLGMRTMAHITLGSDSYFYKKVDLFIEAMEFEGYIGGEE